MKTSTKLQIAFYLVAIPLIVVFIWRENRTAAEIQRNLEKEFDQITRPESLIRVEETRHHKPGVAWVHARYSATPPVGDIEEIYRSQLTSNGWTFYERRSY